MSLYRFSTAFLELTKNAGDVIDFNKKKKENENKNHKYYIFHRLPEILDFNVLMQHENINIDSLHEARKAVGFKPLPPDAKPIELMWIDAVDTEDRSLRHAKYKRVLHWFNYRSGEDGRKEAENNKKEEENNFNKQAKAGWLNWQNRYSWEINFPLLFDKKRIEEVSQDMKEGAIEILKKIFEINKKKELHRNVLTKNININTLPIGTKIYLSEYAIKIFGPTVTIKTAPDNWVDERGMAGSDEFIERIASNTDSLYSIHPAFINVNPNGYIEKAMGSFQPNEKDIINIINLGLKNKGYWATYGHYLIYDLIEQNDEEFGEVGKPLTIKKYKNK